MQHLETQAIVLRRINYGEADRIITVLSRDSGKLRLMAKGVRKATSKLAGGIELFSESSIQYIKGKNDIDTLISTRMVRHFGNIITNMECMNAAYNVLYVVDKVSEHHDETNYYGLFINSLELLDSGTSPKIVVGIFYVTLLQYSGHGINLSQDIRGSAFIEKGSYQYNFEAGGFEKVMHGYPSSVIKVVMLLSTKRADTLMRITGMDDELEISIHLLKRLVEYYLHIQIKE